MFTRSPATIPCEVAPTVAAASPVRTPARALEVGADVRAEGLDGLEQLERRPDRTLGVVLVRRRRPPDRHHGVADELLDETAVALDRLPGASRSSGTAGRGPPRGHGPPRGSSSRRGRRTGPTRDGARSTAWRRPGRAGPRSCRSSPRTPRRTCCRERWARCMRRRRSRAPSRIPYRTCGPARSRSRSSNSSPRNLSSPGPKRTRSFEDRARRGVSPLTLPQRERMVAPGGDRGWGVEVGSPIGTPEVPPRVDVAAAPANRRPVVLMILGLAVVAIVAIVLFSAAGSADPARRRICSWLSRSLPTVARSSSTSTIPRAPAASHSSRSKHRRPRCSITTKRFSRTTAGRSRFRTCRLWRVPKE